MAIISEDDKSGGGQHPGEAQQQQNQAGGWSMHGPGLFASPIPRTVGSEYYINLKNKLQEIYQAADPDVEISVLELSRATEPALDFSSIVVAVRLRSDLKAGAAYHILLLSATGEEIPPYSQQFHDRTINVHRVPGDAINKILVEKAREVVKKAFGVSNAHYVDGEVVGDRFDPKNPAQLQKLALNAAIAGVNDLNRRRQGFADLNLAKLAKPGQISIDINFQRQQLEDDGANIYRSDIIATLTDRKGGDGRDNRQLNTGDRVAEFSRVSSFMDVLWWPIQEQSPFAHAFAPQNLAMTQKFVARQVISNIESSYALTTGAVLLAMSTSLALRSPTNWIQAFRPLATQRKTLDITDIGALNIEGNIPIQQPSGIVAQDPSGFGKPIDTKADDFKSEQLGLFVQALFHRDCIVAMDVPEAGPQTHYLGIFSAAARGNEKAIKGILAAANELTNGEFSKHFAAGTPIFATVPERIHAGRWQDTYGVWRDIRDFDHIAVANIVGPSDPKLIRDWSDTFLRQEYPEDMRLDARRKMIMSLSQDSAKFTGFFQRVTFSGAFLNALDAAISHLLRVNVRTPLSGNDFYNSRGVASYAQQALLGVGTQSYMQNGGGYNPGIGQPAYYTSYRW